MRRLLIDFYDPTSGELMPSMLFSADPGIPSVSAAVTVKNLDTITIDEALFCATTINMLGEAAYGEDSTIANLNGLETIDESWMEARLSGSDPWTPIDDFANHLAIGPISASGTVQVHLRANMPAGAATSGIICACLAVHGRTLPPVIGSFSPTSATNTASMSIDIVGDYFKTGALAYLKRPGETTIIGTSTTVTSSAAMSATFALSGAVSGTWTLSVRNPENVVGTASAAFTIASPVAPAPTVTAIDPATATNDGVASFTITGTGFLSGATAWLSGGK